jgi:hypothetical protein
MLSMKDILIWTYLQAGLKCINSETSRQSIPDYHDLMKTQPPLSYLPDQCMKQLPEWGAVELAFSLLQVWSSGPPGRVCCSNFFQNICQELFCFRSSLRCLRSHRPDLDSQNVKKAPAAIFTQKEIPCVYKHSPHPAISSLTVISGFF